MKDNLIIIGAGGHGRVCYEVAYSMNCWRNIYFLDDNLTIEDDKRIIGKTNDILNFSNEMYQVFVAIGNNNIRKEIILFCKEKGYPIATLVHPTATLSREVIVRNGTVIMPNVVVNYGAEIGEGVILNTSSCIEHECRVGNYAHISPHAVLTGGVHIGEGTHIGASATCIPLISIGCWTIVGAGAVVINNVPNFKTVVGVPAKIIKRK